MRTAALFFISMAAWAQSPVAPSPEPAGSSAGDNVSNYNIVDSFELGYRYRSVGGNVDQYRSSVNYSDGIRLLGGSLSVNSRNGHGSLFDQIILITEGLGNDPYESASLHIEKNRLYRYDMLWRQNDYFNPGLVTGGADGQHLLDTEYHMQDHNLTLFPQSNLKFFLGFSANSQTGDALSSIQLFNDTGNILPLYSNVHRLWREYRVGNEFRIFGIRVNWMRGWEDFKDDTGSALSAPTNAVQSFQSSDPTHGTSPYWRAALFAERKMFSVNGRFTETAGRDAFVASENTLGTAASLQRIQNVYTAGDAQRPVVTGNLNVNFVPESKLTISSSTSVYNIRTLGNSYYSQFDSATQTTTVLFYNFLGIRTIANHISLNYQVTPIFGLTGGYHYSNRLIRSSEQFTFAGAATTTPAQQTNQTNSVDFGIHARPFKPLTVLLSGEIGTNDQPFTPTANRNYHLLNGRAQYRKKAYQLTAQAHSNYNVNSISLSSYSSQSRTYSGNGSWTPSELFSLDAGYSHIHVYSIGGINYFLNQQLTAGDSIYISNINSIYAGLHFTLKKRVDIYAGYTRVQDVGDGRNSAIGASGGPAAGSLFPLFLSAQTFPVKFQSPVGRISVKIANKLRWNAGYQYYGYGQQFDSTLNYQAHTAYTSLSFSF